MYIGPCSAEADMKNSVDPDQLASREASWSESTLFIPRSLQL